MPVVYHIPSHLGAGVVSTPLCQTDLGQPLARGPPPLRDIELGEVRFHLPAPAPLEAQPRSLSPEAQPRSLSPEAHLHSPVGEPFNFDERRRAPAYALDDSVASDDSLVSDDGEESTPSSVPSSRSTSPMIFAQHEGGGALIPKPKGAWGRPGHEGYRIVSAMGWQDDKYQALRVSTHRPIALIEIHVPA